MSEARTIRAYDNLTIADDFIFSKVMQDESICAMMIESLLGIKVGKIEYIESQKSVSLDYNARGVRFDIYVRDSDKIYDIEMQTTNQKNLLWRSRYYQGQMDQDHLQKNMDYSKLPDSFIVFICTFDPFGRELPVYSVKRIFEENGELADNGTHEVYFNCKDWSKADSAIQKSLLRYIATNKVDEDCKEVTVLEKAVSRSKERRDWRREFMTLEMKIWEAQEASFARGVQQGFQQGIQQGLEQGILKERLEMVRKLLKRHMFVEDICELTGLTTEQIEDIAREQK